jgi:hypothetical protein
MAGIQLAYSAMMDAWMITSERPSYIQMRRQDQVPKGLPTLYPVKNVTKSDKSEWLVFDERIQNPQFVPELVLSGIEDHRPLEYVATPPKLGSKSGWPAVPEWQEADGPRR